MSDLIKVFENEQFGKIRMVVIDGKPYAVGVDVARALEYAKPSQAVIDHCKGIRKLGIPSNGGTQETNVVPKGDIIRLIVKAADQSKNENIKAKAEKFESWIFDEVIPTVLETGSYTAKPMTTLEIMAESVRILQEQDKRLKQVEQAQAEQKKELQDIREVITLRPDSWRDGTKSILDKIAIALGGDSEAFKDVRNQSYTELEKRAHCRLGVQLKNAKERMAKKGATKTEINSLRILDMIDKNQRLIEIYLSVVKDMAINHGVTIDDVLF